MMGTNPIGRIGRPISREIALLSYWCVQDRRPITPPPCIRLVVKDATTKEELDIKSVFPISDWPVPTFIGTASYMLGYNFSVTDFIYLQWYWHFLLRPHCRPLVSRCHERGQPRKTFSHIALHLRRNTLVVPTASRRPPRTVSLRSQRRCTSPYVSEWEGECTATAAQ